MSASNPPTSQSLEELFGEPTSVYTDADAVEDGFIVDLANFTNVRFLSRCPIPNERACASVICNTPPARLRPRPATLWELD